MIDGAKRSMLTSIDVALSKGFVQVEVYRFC